MNCLQAAVMILQVTAEICCTELRMLYFVCSERAILVQNVPYFLRVSQTIHCPIAQNNYFSLQLCFLDFTTQMYAGSFYIQKNNYFGLLPLK